MEYASKAVGNTALGLSIGALGTELLGGILGNFMGSNGNTCNAPVSRYDLTMAQELAAKDAEIGLLRADKYTDQKITETYTVLQNKIEDLAKEVRANKDEQYGINLNQAVLNGTTNATISCIQQQIAALQALTKLVVPNSSVCPGWGDVTVTPATTTTTTTPAA